ncbi:hypothetical protein ACX80V_17005 [Arthrobacter sp. MDT3-24]
MFALSGPGSDLAGEIGDGEGLGGDGQSQDGGQRGSGTGLVQIDAADSGGTDLGWGRQPVQDAVGQEGHVDAVEHGGEPVDHAGEPGDDGGELLQYPAGV